METRGGRKRLAAHRYATALAAFAAVAALAFVAGPASAQQYGHQFGLCGLNMGPLIQEDSAWVRSGNMGTEFACFWARLDVGAPGGWFAGLLVSPTPFFVWARDPERPISRWSHRPGYHDPDTGYREPFRTSRAVWVVPTVGYALHAGPVAIRPEVGLVWPTGMAYDWGASVGAIPAVGVELGVELGWFELGVRGMAAHKRKNAWTVLQDYSTPPGQTIRKRAHIVLPVAITAGFRIGG